VATIEQPLIESALWETLQRPWLVGYDWQQWTEKVIYRREQLAQQFKPAWASENLLEGRPLLLLAEPDPVDFLAGFLAALLAGWDVALANSQWGAQEWRSVARLIEPNIVWGAELTASEKTAAIVSNSAGPSAILIPTGGSAGEVKFVCHHWSSLMASVAGFCHCFGDAPINTHCVLPLYHVSGLMQILRAWVSGGQVAIAPFKQLLEQLEAGQPLVKQPQDWFISLVPTQLERLMQTDQSMWLSQFRAVLLGGAPPWPALLDRAADRQIPLCLSYGMSETAAMVTALRPTAFLEGDRSSGEALPHASVQIVHNQQPLPAGEIGQIVVRSKAVAQGYYGTSSPAFEPGIFYTDDLGYLSADGQLHITGRASDKIISGGENIFPAEVEAALRATGLVKDVCVLGWPDPQWGEAVIAVYVPAQANVGEADLKQALAQTDPTPALSRYKWPKYWIAIDALPRNAQGKLNRQNLLTRLATLSNR
jgi:O-succinylbenzoic acid--CoA ligase